MIKLNRVSQTPILSPIPDHPWEATAVFNCGVTYHNGLVHMIYRATDVSSNGKDGTYINNFGYAVSINGIQFNRLQIRYFKMTHLKNYADQKTQGL